MEPSLHHPHGYWTLPPWLLSMACSLMILPYSYLLCPSFCGNKPRCLLGMIALTPGASETLHGPAQLSEDTIAQPRWESSRGLWRCVELTVPCSVENIDLADSREDFIILIRIGPKSFCRSSSGRQMFSPISYSYHRGAGFSSGSRIIELLLAQVHCFPFLFPFANWLFKLQG